ncbi:dipeptidase PepV [Streptococcus chenjunshii]|uniref:Dipeptidase PepV n=1 Tax=Streptococcus chenjunshii TaxID=2173853 RepID=A0A372KJ50_9STRE|nr:dipeptidase PepV [Streptococcus chenjunshii]AXQ79336.1 dipeptidase PepV [Streptococcus chenjunshii]RFU50128.1 dipeptidase PepV [Streptococcus chenjunshii]RFU52280.1 dipeptidase PepV [Streptococcus chenjunshii]
MINWAKVIKPYKEELLTDLDGLLRIPSVKNLKTASADAPFGTSIQEALDYILELGKRDGFTAKDVDHYAGHLEIGQGDKLLGILSHLDVVPADPSQWETNPFIPTVKNDRLYARGALDDKGPALLAYYAVKILKDLGVTWNQRIRLIYGTDEENDWKGVHYYFTKEEMPNYGIVPDGIFPLIYAEKGVISIDLTKDLHSENLVEFKSGSAYNVVPDFASAKLVYHADLENDFSAFLEQYGLKGHFAKTEDYQHLKIFGYSAHAASPSGGTNAVLHLTHFLTNLTWDESANNFLKFINHYLFDDFTGQSFGIDFNDNELGNVTINTAFVTIEKGKAKIGLNLRYPASYDFEIHYQKLSQVAKQHNIATTVISHKLPSYSNIDDPETKILLETYRKHTSDQTPPLAIGGITYGRIFERGITFGPVFLGKPATLHQPNEYIELDDLFKGLEIYLDALYQIATAEGQTAD